VGGTQHIFSEAFKRATGTDSVLVPYRGEPPLVTDFLGGRIDWFIATPHAVNPHVKAGKVKMLAVTGEQRFDLAPTVPTFKEEGITDLVVVGWYALFAPAATPTAIVEKLSREVSDIIRAPEFSQYLRDNGLIPTGLGHQEFGPKLRAIENAFGKMIRGEQHQGRLAAPKAAAHPPLQLNGDSSMLRLRQICLVAPELETTVAQMQRIFDIAPCHRGAGVAKYGLVNALFIFGHQFLEIVAPTSGVADDTTAAGRYLQRSKGRGGYMAIFDCDDPERRQKHVTSLGMRIAHVLNDPGKFWGIQLHPLDTRATMLEFDRIPTGNEALDGTLARR
jgi:hypothetical protein